MGRAVNAVRATHPPRLSAIPRDIAAVADYERHAHERLDDKAWTYLCGGAADELTLQDNQAAFRRLRMKGRVLADVRGGHTRLELFGRSYEHPVFLAPVAYQRLFHPDGELASALGAGALAAGMVVSTLASCRIEDIAAAAQAPLWFQLYMQADRSHTLELVRRAEASGYEVLVVTVDAPIAGIRNREQRARFSLPQGVGAVNLTPSAAPAAKPAEGASIVFDQLMAHAPGWQDIEWLAASTRLPVVVKGILDADDALLALQRGAAGLVVSNHGGRTLDTLPASIDALPSIVEAVAGRAPVLLDGGIRRGSDIFKAIALGASAVLVGRPYVHALAAAGALGVAHVLRILREELEVCMVLNGCAELQAIDRSRLFAEGRQG
ncbi:MAG: alpha-hydroxy-acid oxidizing protein [Zoogloea sp.]|nr:alpha-hydroxy-acid oxidizing protein [Zoogloea sp.]